MPCVTPNRFADGNTQIISTAGPRIRRDGGKGGAVIRLTVHSPEADLKARGKCGRTAGPLFPLFRLPVHSTEQTPKQHLHLQQAFVVVHSLCSFCSFHSLEKNSKRQVPLQKGLSTDSTPAREQSKTLSSPCAYQSTRLGRIHNTEFTCRSGFRLPVCSPGKNPKRRVPLQKGVQHLVQSQANIRKLCSSLRGGAKLLGAFVRYHYLLEPTTNR